MAEAPTHLRAHEAAALLGDSEALVERSRDASSAMLTGAPLITWGLAYVAGYLALEFWPHPGGVAGLFAALGVAAVISWWPRGRRIRTGTERPVRLGWLCVLAASPFLIGAIEPVDFGRAMLLLGGLWGMAMALTAIALSDTALSDTALFVICFATVVIAGLAPQAPWGWPLATFGVCSGAALLSLGVTRAVRGARRG
ncbi:hypothetical protein [Nigerium massiliense]|uniref:hypothetical protein n=1 Tax=Nigerium massiliense TaxID=1522317 RepID=UPI00058AE917|nr:hypothetical protein [Nigerium massiliense]